MDQFPAAKVAHEAARMDLLGHSLAADGGATQVDFGAWHKIASHLQPALLNAVTQGGAMAAMPEGNKFYTAGSQVFTGQNRCFHEFPSTARGTFGPYLATSQLVCVWYGANDLAWTGPSTGSTMPAFREGLRTILARLRSAVVFENDNTTASFGVTPCTYTGTWATTSASWSLGSGGSFQTCTTAYPTNYVTLQIPPDYGAGTLAVQFLSGAAGDGASWDIVNVTDGASTALASGQDVRNTGGFNHAQSTATRQAIACVRRVTLSAAPTTTIATSVLHPQDTTITVASTTGFPAGTAGDPGCLQIGGERITYTGKTSTTFTGCTRRVGTTNSYPHQIGEAVTGSRTIQVRPTALTTTAYFDCWSLGASTSPLIFVMKQNRGWGYQIWNAYPYAQSVTKLNGGTSIGASSVTIASTTLNGAGAATGNLTVLDSSIVEGQNANVIVDSEVMFADVPPNTTTLNVTANRGIQGTTAATHLTGATVTAWVRVGDTITIGTGATAETRKVTSVSGASIGIGAIGGGTATLSNTHSSGEQVVVGIQDYDMRNIVNPAVQAIADEFTDSRIFTVDPEVGLFGSPDGTKDSSVFIPDGIHFNDEGHARLAAYFLGIATPKMTSYAQNAKPAVPDRMAYFDSFYNQVTFQNSWTSYNTTIPSVGAAAAGTAAPFGYRKDFVTRRVRLRGAIKNANPANSNLTICNLPAGFRPNNDEQWVVATNVGPQILEVRASGDVLFPLAMVNSAFVDMNVMFEAGG